MQADISNYRRARTVSLIGLILQTAMAAALGIYTAVALRDHAALTATVYASMGIVAWLALVVLYDWHRRERVEKLEVERLAADPAASAFEEADTQIRTAARRLEGVQKIGMPIFGLSIGAVLLSVGLVRFAQGRAAFAEQAEFPETAAHNWGLVIGLAVAFVGFIFARFVSGMAKQRVWASLGAGASFAVGTALLGLAMTVGRFVDIAGGGDFVLRLLQPALPLFLAVIGAEIFLNFVLALYRPRKPGEEPTPIFDSKVLGLLAAPDKVAENIGEAVNYQFGIEVSGTWFYQLLRRWWSGLVLLVVVIMWSMTAFVIVEPHQKALILTFGKPAKEDGRIQVAEPGLHLKWPWPISEVYVPKDVVETDGVEVATETVTGLRRMTLGAYSPRPDQNILWTKDNIEQHHPGGEDVQFFSLVQPMPVNSDVAEAAGAGATADPFSDLSLVVAEMPVHWIVDNVALFEQFAEPGSREALLRLLGQREALRYLASVNITSVLSDERRAIAGKLRDLLRESYMTFNDGEGPGIELVFVGMGNVHPQKDVASKFEVVAGAQQNREAKIERARERAIETLTSVVPVSTDIAGQSISAGDIIERIENFESLRASGASQEVIGPEAFEIAQILEQAGGEAGTLLIDASAERWRRHMGERAKATLFEGQAAAFSAAPGLYRATRYFEAVRGAMEDARVYLVDDGFADLTVRVELQTKRETGVFDPEAGANLQ